MQKQSWTCWHQRTNHVTNTQTHTVHVPGFTPHSTLYISHSTLSTLHTSNFPVYTSQSTRSTPHSALSTLYTPNSTPKFPLSPHSTVSSLPVSSLWSPVSTCIRTFDIHTCIHLHPCMHTYRRARAHMQLQCVALIYITYIHYFACCSVPDYLQYLLCDKAVQAGALHVGAQFFPASFATKP